MLRFRWLRVAVVFFTTYMIVLPSLRAFAQYTNVYSSTAGGTRSSSLGGKAVPTNIGNAAPVVRAAAINPYADSPGQTSAQTMQGPLNVPTAYTSSTGNYLVSSTRGVAGYVTPELYGAWADGRHDDTAAIQACWDASASSSLFCRMSPSGGGGACVGNSAAGCYLANGQLVVKPSMHVQGNSQLSTFIKSEYNGPAVVMVNGVNNGVVMENLRFALDKTLANSAGFYFIAVPTGSPAQGGLWDSHFQNIEFDNPAKECIRLDGGGKEPGYQFNFPNQANEFLHITCNGPMGQLHPANLLEISGQMGQVLFQGGYWNADPTNTGKATEISYTYYPHPLVLLQPLGGSNSNLAPGNITFSDISVQYGQIGFSLNYATNITINDGSHFEDLGTFIVANYSTFYVENDYFGNVGTSAGGMFNLGNENVATIANNTGIASSGYYMSAMATCSGANQVTFSNNFFPNQSPTTSNCATNQVGITSSTLTTTASTMLVNGDGGAVPISTLVSRTDPGKTLSLIAWGDSFKMTSGGNIQFGGFATPLTIPRNSLITLRLYDLGPTYVVESVGGLTGSPGTAAVQPNTLLAGPASGSATASSFRTLVPADLPAAAMSVKGGSIKVTANDTYVICSSNCTVTPPAPAAGVRLCVRNAPGTATVITMAALGPGNYYELTSRASWGTANHTVVSGGAATDELCLVGYDANHYAVTSFNGTWTD